MAETGGLFSLGNRRESNTHLRCIKGTLKLILRRRMENTEPDQSPSETTYQHALKVNVFEQQGELNLNKLKKLKKLWGKTKKNIEI